MTSTSYWRGSASSGGQELGAHLFGFEFHLCHHKLCDLGQGSEPLCTSISSSIKGDERLGGLQVASQLEYSTSQTYTPIKYSKGRLL